MPRLTDRVRARAEARAEAERVERLVQRYARATDRLSVYEDAEERQLARRWGLYYELAADELEDVDSHPFPGVPAAAAGPTRTPDPIAAIRREAAEDRRNNVLYQLWMEQRLKAGPADLELEEFSEAVAGRALVRLLAYVPKGRQLLAGVADDDTSDWIPSPESIRRFVDAGGLAETDDQTFLARLFAEVPGSRRALFRLLGAYKLVVRLQAERDGEGVAGILPGEDYGQELVTWDQLGRLLGVPPTSFERTWAEDASLARGVARYLEGDSLAAAAEAAGISQGRLRRRLVELKLLRGRGRPATTQRSVYHHAVTDREARAATRRGPQGARDPQGRAWRSDARAARAWGVLLPAGSGGERRLWSPGRLHA